MEPLLSLQNCNRAACFLLASCLSLSVLLAQAPEPESTPVAPVTVQALSVPGRVIIADLVLAIRNASLQEIAAIVSQQSVADLAALLKAADPKTLGKILSSAATVTSALDHILVAAVADPRTLDIVLKASSPDVLGHILSAAVTDPATMNIVLGSMSPQQLESFLSARAAPVGFSSTVSSLDADILVAISQFWAVDPRYKEISHYSYFGKRLHDVRDKVKQQGMTPENKTEMLAVYGEATEALLRFQAAEKKRQLGRQNKR
jgi:hypothetical protein